MPRWSPSARFVVDVIVVVVVVVVAKDQRCTHFTRGCTHCVVAAVAVAAAAAAAVANYNSLEFRQIQPAGHMKKPTKQKLSHMSSYESVMMPVKLVEETI